MSAGVLTAPAPAPPATERHNAFDRETFVFDGDPADRAVARFTVRLGPGGSGGGNGLRHRHPGTEERFLVRSGVLRVEIDGVARRVWPGEVAVVPPGAVHAFANDAPGETVATVEFRPGRRFVRFFENFAALTEQRPAWFSPAGDPRPLLTALTLHHYAGHLYLPRVPIVLQRLAFALLARLARWRGYRVLVPRDAPVEDGAPAPRRHAFP